MTASLSSKKAWVAKTFPGGNLENYTKMLATSVANKAAAEAKKVAAAEANKTQ